MSGSFARSSARFGGAVKPHELDATDHYQVAKATHRDILRRDRKRQRSDRRLYDDDDDEMPDYLQQHPNDDSDVEDQPAEDSSGQAGTGSSTSSSAASRRPRERRSYYDTKLESEEQWRLELPDLKQHAKDSFLNIVQENLTVQLQRKASLIRMIQQYHKQPLHSCKGTWACGNVRFNGGPRAVNYHSTECSFSVDVQPLHCQTCNKKWQVPATAIRCLGGTAFEPNVLYDWSLLSHAHHLVVGGAVAVNTYVNTLNEQLQYTYLHGPNSHQKPFIDDRLFGDALGRFSNIFRTFGGPESLTGTAICKHFYPGPWGKCPACCVIPMTQDTPSGWPAYHLKMKQRMSSMHRQTEAAAAALAAGLPQPTAPSFAIPDLSTPGSPLPGPPTHLAASSLPPPSSLGPGAVLPSTHPPPPHNAVSAPNTDSVRCPPASPLTATTATSPPVSTSGAPPPNPHPLQPPPSSASGPIPHAAPPASTPLEHPASINWPTYRSGDLAFKASRPEAKRPCAFTADGAQKLTHFAKCGRTTTAVYNKLGPDPISPHNEYFEPEVANAYANAMVTVDTCNMPPEEDTECQAELLAARNLPPAQKSANLDVRVVVGCVCPHTIPGRGSFLSSSRPENFLMFDIVFSWLLQHMRLKVDAISLDVMCRYFPHLQKHNPGLAAEFKHALVGWLHANSGHNLQCQLKYSGMYRPLTGRLIGENCEQLFAGLKPHAKTTKYMSLNHREQRIDDVLNHIANKKYEGFAELLRQTYLITIRRVEQLKSEEAQVLASAAAAGQVLDGEEEFTVQPALSVPTDSSMQYVKVLTELNAMSSMESVGASFMSVLTEAAAMQLLTKARDQTQRAKLEKLAASLEVKLHIDKTERWNPTDDTFKVHLSRLHAVEIKTAQLAVERDVSLLATRLEHCFQERESGNRTDGEKSAITKTYKKIQGSLQTLQFWTEAAGFQWHPISQADVYKNRLPWYLDPSGTGSNSQDHVKLKLHKLRSERRRSEEELLYLPTDAVKVLLYYGRQVALLQAWLMDSCPQLDEGPLSGMVILMYERMQKVQRLQLEAYNVFVSLGLVIAA